MVSTRQERYELRSPLLRSFIACEQQPQIIGMLINEIEYQRLETIRIHGRYKLTALLIRLFNSDPLSYDFKYCPSDEERPAPRFRFHTVFEVLARMTRAKARRMFTQLWEQLLSWKLDDKKLMSEAKKWAEQTAKKENPNQPDLAFLNMLKDYKTELMEELSKSPLYLFTFSLPNRTISQCQWPIPWLQIARLKRILNPMLEEQALNSGEDLPVNGKGAVALWDGWGNEEGGGQTDDLMEE